MMQRRSVEPIPRERACAGFQQQHYHVEDIVDSGFNGELHEIVDK